MARIVVPYQDFSGGDFGRAEAWKAPANSFSALNMYVTKTGELTVRGGLRNVTPTGVVAHAATYLGEFAQNSGDNFAPYVFYTYSTGATTDWNFFSPLDVSTLNSPTALGNVPVNDHQAVSGSTYAVTRAGAGTGATWGTTNHGPSAFAGSSGAFSVALYLNRLVVNTTGNVLLWSDINATTGAPNFNSWTATNTVSVGSADTSIIAIRSQRGHLVVFKPEGIFVITGDMAVATVRQVTSTFGPLNPSAIRQSRDEMLWFVPGQGATPWMFDGAKATELSRYPLAPPSFFNTGGLTASTAVAGLPSEDRGVFFLGGANSLSTTVALGWLYLNGVWTKHTFPFTLQPFVAPVSAAVLTDPSLPATFNETLWRATRQVSSLTFVDTGATPKFYSWTLSERPGTETTPPKPGGATLFMPEKAGDDSTSQVTGSVTFPEWHSQAAEEALVRSVIVDFRSYNTGGSLTNHFDVTVNALREWNALSPVASQTLSWDEAGSSSAQAGTIKRQVFSFGDQGLGNGFQIALTNVRGIAIQRIQVIAETQPLRSAA